MHSPNPPAVREAREVRDPRTGRALLRLTTGPYTSFAPYMYRRAFSVGERHVVFSSDRSGRFELYRCEIATGEVRALTAGSGYDTTHLSMTVDPAGREAYYVAGDGVRAVSVETGESRAVLRCGAITGGAAPASFILSPDGETVYAHMRRGSDGRTVIAAGPTRTGDELGAAAQVVHVQPEGIPHITHLLCSPSEPGVLTYNRHPDRQNDPAAPRAERARCRRLDLNTGADEPFLVMPPGRRATHEYWSPDGSRLFFHRKSVPGWVPTEIASVPRDGGGGDGPEVTIHYASDRWRLGHSSVSPKGDRLVTDTQDPGENPLILVYLTTGRDETLCWPDASGAPHPNHVHPAFSPSGRYVVFTSDAGGHAQVYLLPLES